MKFAIAAAMLPVDELPILAKAAEEAGFYGFELADSVFYPEVVSVGYPYTGDGSRMGAPETPMPDPLITIAALSAVTERLVFGISVLKAPLRNPLLLAKQVATLAVLSKNRLMLGLGLSWMPEEFEFTGTQMRTRGERTEEIAEIIRLVCAGRGPEFVAYQGQHYQFDRLMISPAPDQPVPLLFGGHSEAGLGRAARLGDGWMSVNRTIDELRADIDRIQDMRVECGRANLPFEVDIAPVGDCDLDDFRALAEAGVTIVRQQPWQRQDSLQQRLDAIARFGDEVIAKY